MADERVTNLAFVRAQAGKSESLQEALRELATGTRKEPGSLIYEVHRSGSDAGQFFVYEIWNSQSDLDAHLKGAAIAAFVAHVPEFVDGDVDMRTFTPVDVVRI